MNHFLAEDFNQIHARKSQEKNFLEKKLEIKTLVKKSQFSEVLGQNVTGNKVLSFNFLGLVPKILWGLPIKSREIKSITGIKALQKKSWENEVNS